MRLPEPGDAGPERIVPIKDGWVDNLIQLGQPTGGTPGHRERRGKLQSLVYREAQGIGWGLVAEVEIRFEMREATGATGDMGLNMLALCRAS